MFVLPQIGVGTTSKSVMHDRMHANAMGYTHFRMWSPKLQIAAIQACGLASSNYRKKEEKLDVLGRLATCKLPIDPDEVKHGLERRGIEFGNKRQKRTELAKLLLSKMSLEEVNEHGAQSPRLQSYPAINSSSHQIR